MRVKTLAVRILNQLRHDKRTVALIIVAPLLVLTLVYFIMGSDNGEYRIGILSAPDSLSSQLQNSGDVAIHVEKIDNINMKESFKSETITAAVSASSDLKKVNIYLDGTDATKAKKVEACIRSAVVSAIQKDMKALALVSAAEPDFQLKYVYGSEDGSFFDNYGAPLIGLLVFFFVFLIAGINFLAERTSGTLEKMLSTPILRREIIIGYTLGFSILALIQTVFVTLFVVYVLDLTALGSIWYVLIINLLTAVTALTLGMLLSTLAHSEFQMVQFIPIVILPQVFLCGLFELSGGWKIAGYFMPLSYTVDGLKQVMLRGSGFSDIWVDCAVLLGCSMVFMVINTALLRKHRSI